MGKLVAALAVIALAAAGGYYLFAGTAATPQDRSAEAAQVVAAFGAKLQAVPLTADRDIAAQAIQENYADFVTAELLARWTDAPVQAPGRLTSSPWPERIDVERAARNADGTYDVTGTVIEVTSKELAEGGIADQYPMRATVVETGMGLRISAFAVER